MSFIASFEVHGIPRPQPRPRLGSGHVYTPTKVKAWKSAVVLCGRRHRPLKPLTGAVSVSIELRMPRPKRLMRKRDPEGPVRHVAKPDIDNVGKAVLDALTDDRWFEDDALVCELRISKNYHAKQGAPGALIAVEQLPALEETPQPSSQR